MSIKNLILSLTLITSLLVLPTKVIAEPIEIPLVVSLTVEQQVEYFAKLYGADVSLVSKVMECESGGNHKAIGDSGLSKGVFQYQRSTFERHEKLLGEDLNYQSSYDQIKLASFAIANGMGNEWTAYRAIQNGGKYSFYSKQLQKSFVVYCKL